MYLNFISFSHIILYLFQHFVKAFFKISSPHLKKNSKYFKFSSKILQKANFHPSLQVDRLTNFIFYIIIMKIFCHICGRNLEKTYTQKK